MLNRRAIHFLGATALSTISGILLAQVEGMSGHTAASPAGAGIRLAGSYGKLPLAFELNRGQAGGTVKFLSRGRGYELFLTGTGAVLNLQRAGVSSLAPGQKISLPSAERRSLALGMEIVGASAGARVAGIDEMPGKTNYIVGNDPGKWRVNVPTYSKVRYERVYPGVDLVYYGDDGRLEYDFIVAPGGDPKAIRLRLAANSAGTPRLSIDDRGDLVVAAGDGEVRFHRPVVYQPAGGKSDANRVLVDGRYVVQDGSEVAFEVAPYDRSKTLVIDPVLTYSTYLGGTGADGGSGIAADAAGNAYVVGTTSSVNLPTMSPIQGTLKGSSNIFVTKLNAAGTGLVYSTYLGGSGSDTGSAIALDAAGNAYITGTTSSADFPTANAFQGALNGGSNAFVAKLNASGTALVYSTFLGGPGATTPYYTVDDQGSGIAVDSSGNAYVTGYTLSSSFPTLNPIQGALAGAPNAFVTKLNAAGNGLVYSTYLGGSGADSGVAIAVDSAGNAYVTGSARSGDFPTVNPIQASLSGPQSVFASKLNSSGSALVYSTYLGGSVYFGSNGSVGLGIAVDQSGDAYVTGSTFSANFPTVNAIMPSKPNNQSVTFNSFLSKLNPAGNALVYSTYMGGSDVSDDSGQGVAVDSSGNAYVTGYTSSGKFPTVNPVQAASAGNWEAFVYEVNAAGSALVYSTYLGGSSGDFGAGIALDSTGNAYVTGTTQSSDFHATTGSFQTVNGGGPNHAYIAKISSVEDEDTGFPNLIGGNIFSGNQTINGTIAATSFLGDGSGLTGIVAATANSANFATTAGTANNALALGGTPPSGFVLKAGDTMAGALNLPANGLVAGSNQLVLSGDNVGIGTATPDTAPGYRSLHLDNAGTGFGGTFLQLSHSGTGNKARIVSDPNGLIICSGCGGSTTPAPIRIKAGEINSGTDSHVTLQPTGNLGIGTVNPTEKLDVAGNINASGTVKAGGGIVFADGSTQLSAAAGLLSVTGGSGITSTGGQTPTLSLNTGFTDARYLRLTGGTLSGSLAAIAFSGNGGALVSLNPANLSAGTAGINISGNAATAANAVNAANLGGIAASTYARLDIGNAFAGNQSVAGNLNVSGNSANGGSVTIGSGTAITKHLSMTFGASFPALKPSACSMLIFTLTGASDGDTLALGVPNAMMTGGGTIAYSGWVSATNTITLRACNIDPNSPQKTAGTGAIRVDVWKH